MESNDSPEIPDRGETSDIPGLPSGAFCNTRKEDTVLNILHIGHSYFTHSFLWKKEDLPVCLACNKTITVKHLLIECADLLEVRKKCFEERSLFRSVNPEKIFDYLKEIGMFYKV